MAKKEKALTQEQKKKVPFNVFSKKGLATLAMAGVMMATPFMLVGCADGKDGQNGKDGTNGLNGSQWYANTTNIDDVTYGVDGDFYYDTDDYKLYRKENGSWVLKVENFGKPGTMGNDGKDGDDGSTPTITIDSEGYWVIDGISTNVKAKGDKGDPGTPGKDGEDGASWFSGALIEGTGTGISATIENSKIGDIYFNTNTCDIYQCTAENEWKWIANIKGANGENGYDRVYISKSGGADNPVVISEKGANIYNFECEDEQKITIHRTNRFDINSANFQFNGYSSTHKLIKENNGLTINSQTLESTVNSCFAYCDYTAEFSGTLWLSCDAETDGDVSDVGMNIRVNDNPQSLCRGSGRLSESVTVSKGDKITLLFYARIGTSEANTIRYKNIMLQYETLTDFVEYKEDVSNYINNTKTIVLNGEEDLEWTTTATSLTNGAEEEKYYAVYTNLDVSDIKDGELPSNNGECDGNIVVEGIDLVSYNAVYKNSVGIGFSTTGKILLYVGPGYNKTKIKEYLSKHPITITYKLNTEKYVGFDENIEIDTGNIITSDNDFAINYTYLSQKKTTK